jgi:hypothetical protein
LLYFLLAIIKMVYFNLIRGEEVFINVIGKSIIVTGDVNFTLSSFCFLNLIIEDAIIKFSVIVNYFIAKIIVIAATIVCTYYYCYYYCC